MATRFTIICFIYFKVANSQYYSAPAHSYLSYSYYSPTSISAAPTFAPAYTSIPPTQAFGTTYASIQPPPTFGPTYTNNPQAQQKRSIPKSKKTSPCPKCSPSTASAYFLPTPTEKVKATVLSKDKLDKSIISPPVYSCPLCNNFADVLPNSKITPPPPTGPVLPGILDEVPTVLFPKDLILKDPSSTKSPTFLDMYEKNKFPKNLSFDQELLEGFLTGLGITL